MEWQISLFIVLVLISHVGFCILPEVSMTVPEIISYYNYPVEIVEVQTEDGYILTLHR